MNLKKNLDFHNLFINFIMTKQIKKPKTRSPGYSKRKGSNYERKIVKELKELGFDVSTTRLMSKNEDANKIDIHDNRGDLPCKIQAKSTQQIPPYFKIRSESTVDPNEFTIF